MLRRVSDLEDNYLNNIRGINIYGIDNEKLGTVDDALVDDVTGDLRYLLVDSGWVTVASIRRSSRSGICIQRQRRPVCQPAQSGRRVSAGTPR